MDDDLGKDCVVCSTKGDNCDHQHPCHACSDADLPDVCSYDWSITNPRITKIFQPQPNWEDRLEGFSDASMILPGTCGVVYRVPVKDKNVVAVKVLFHHLTIPSLALQLGLKQAWNWRQLSHKNVTPLLGVADFSKIAWGCPPRRQLCFISPWMEQGNILQYLGRHPEASRLNLLTGIVEGLTYLHEQEPPVIHGGLRAGNVLIQIEGGHPKAVLADFGNSQTIQYYCETYDPDASYTPKSGNPRWLAFERVRPWDYGIRGQVALPTTASDVFELLRAFLEVFTGKRPFFYIPDCAAVTVSELVMFEWAIPDRPSEACVEFDDDWWLLMSRAWSRHIEERPNLQEISVFLQNAILRAGHNVKASTHTIEISATEQQAGIRTTPDVGWWTWLSLAHWRRAFS